MGRMLTHRKRTVEFPGLRTYLHLGGRSPPTVGTASSANSNRRTTNPTRLSRTWSPFMRSRAGAACRPSRTPPRAAPSLRSRCRAVGGVLRATGASSTAGCARDTAVDPAECAGSPSRARRQSAVVRIRTTQDDNLWGAFAYLVFCGSHKDMFRRGVQDRIAHTLILDEAHCHCRLKLISTMAKECRKSGVFLALASQQAMDADTCVFSGIANYLVLGSMDTAARFPVMYIFDSCLEQVLIDRLEEMNVFSSLHICEDKRRQMQVDQ